MKKMKIENSMGNGFHVNIYPLRDLDFGQTSLGSVGVASEVVASGMARRATGAASATGGASEGTSESEGTAAWASCTTLAAEASEPASCAALAAGGA